MSNKEKKWFSLNLKNEKKSGGCGCGKTTGSCDSNTKELKRKDGVDQVFDLKMDRRSGFKKLTASLLIGAGAVSTS